MFEIFVCLFVLKGEQETREGTCSEFPCLVERTPKIGFAGTGFIKLDLLRTLQHLCKLNTRSIT